MQTIQQISNQLPGDDYITTNHEVLTKTGWKRYDEITMYDEVATYNQNTKCLEYQLPQSINIVPHYKGDMYEVRSEFVNLTVSKDHKLFVSIITNNVFNPYSYKDITADKLENVELSFKNNADYVCAPYQFVMNAFENENEKIFDMTAWLTLFGICSENQSSFDIYNNIDKLVINYENNKFIKNKLTQYVPILGYEYKDENNKIIIDSPQLFNYFLTTFHDDEFGLPDWVLKLNKDQSLILLDSILCCDPNYNYNSLRVYIPQITFNLADKLQQLCLHAGWFASYHTKTKYTHEDICMKDVMTIYKNNFYPIINDTYTYNKMLYDFNGPVFNVRVPNKKYYVRMDGRGVWITNKD